MKRLAFLISVQKDARQLRDLVNSLPAEAEFYIHVDRKRNRRHFEEGLQRQDVHFINHRVSAISGSLNEAEVQVALIRAALEGDKADYLVNISSLDYPLWSNSRIEAFFDNAGDKEFLQGVAMPGQGKTAYKYTDFQLLQDHHWRSGTWKNRVRSLARHMLAGGHVHKTLRIHCPDKTYTLYRGGTAWAITRGLGRLIVNEWDNNRHLKKYFSTSYRPVETFIPTVAFNSGFASRCMPVRGRYDGVAKLLPLTYISGRTAKVLTEDDFSDIKSADKMFCRQVVTGYSDGVKSLIDASRKGGQTVKDVVA